MKRFTLFALRKALLAVALICMTGATTKAQIMPQDAMMFPYPNSFLWMVNPLSFYQPLPGLGMPFLIGPIPMMEINRNLFYSGWKPIAPTESISYSPVVALSQEKLMLTMKYSFWCIIASIVAFCCVCGSFRTQGGGRMHHRFRHP